MPTYEELMTEAVKCSRVGDRFALSSPSKISCSDHCAFSLPAGPKFACPGATEACEDCYATKFRHKWPVVVNAFARNWKLIKSFEKKNDVFSATKMLSGSIPNTGLFRIHESGDWHSQWYIDIWSEVIKSRKDVNFWAYTRSFGFDYRKILHNKNFMLWASTDEHNYNEAVKMVRRYKSVKYAYGPIKKNQDIPPNSKVCPVTSKELKVEGACEKCGFCVTRDKAKKNIAFLKH